MNLGPLKKKSVSPTSEPSLQLQGLDPLNKDTIKRRCSLPLALRPNLLHDFDYLLVLDVSCEVGLTNTKGVRTMVNEKHKAKYNRLWW